MEAVILNFVQEILNNEEQERVRRENFQRLRVRRQLIRDISDPFTLDAEYFRKHYRLTPPVALRLVEILHPILIGERNSMLPSHVQVLTTLRFLAEGALQKGFAADFNHPISQATASRCIERVISAINFIADRFINFPNTHQERQRIQNGFQRTIRIPGVIGLVDGFLVSMIRPTENEEAFFNYRVGSSLNVQIVADCDNFIRNLRICPGSNNDRYIWQMSEMKEHMDFLRANQDIVREEGRYYILGDSGYTLSPVLLTPILNAQPGSPEAIYTLEHVTTRSRVERTIGLLTNIWMAIKRARKLHYRVDKVANIINACAVVHNFRLFHGIRYDADDDGAYQLDNDNIQPDIQHARNEGDYAAGVIERNEIINNYYALI